MNLYIPLIFIFAAVAIVSTTTLVLVVRHYQQEKNKATAEEIQRLKDRIQQLESMGPRTIGHAAYQEFMNGLTGISTIIDDAEIIKNKVENSLAHFGRVIERQPSRQNNKKEKQS
jgi:hypothetical protein